MLDIIRSLEKNKNGHVDTFAGMGLRFDDSVPEKILNIHFNLKTDWLYKEKTGFKNELFIIGGGHCSLAFSKLMRSMDFYIRIYDERKDLKTMVENEAAHEKHFVD